jgi:hypothetical protein
MGQFLAGSRHCLNVAGRKPPDKVTPDRRVAVSRVCVRGEPI